jgi:hypothetical protein
LRPEIGNLVRELSESSSKPQISYQSAMERVMSFCVNHKNIGWTLKTTGIWSENEGENEVGILVYWIWTIQKTLKLEEVLRDIL